MMFISLVVSTTLLMGDARALPTVVNVEKRAVDTTLFTRLNLMEQYSAAAYCRDNSNSTGNQITCSMGICDMVQQANATSAVEFADTQLASDVTGYVSVDPTNQLIVIAFRGSASLDNWITNLKFNQVDTNLCEDCKAHDGFWQSWQDSRTQVLDSVKQVTATNPTYKIVATGHSLGGAIATLAAADMRNNKYEVDLYTYGAPRISGSTLSTYITNQGNNYRVTHFNDVVPRVPPRFFGFEHIAPEYYIGTENMVPVSTDNVTMLEGSDSKDGNVGHVFEDVGAHLWYFNAISGCTT